MGSRSVQIEMLSLTPSLPAVVRRMGGIEAAEVVDSVLQVVFAVLRLPILHGEAVADDDAVEIWRRWIGKIPGYGRLLLVRLGGRVWTGYFLRFSSRPYLIYSFHTFIFLLRKRVKSYLSKTVRMVNLRPF